MKSVGIFINKISKSSDIKRKRTPRVHPGRSNKVKTYFTSVGSPCNDRKDQDRSGQVGSGKVRAGQNG